MPKYVLIYSWNYTKFEGVSDVQKTAVQEVIAENDDDAKSIASTLGLHHFDDPVSSVHIFRSSDAINVDIDKSVKGLIK